MSSTDPPPGGRQSAPAPEPARDEALKFLDFVFGEDSQGHVEFRFLSPGRRPKDAERPTYIALPLNHERVSAEVLDRGEKLGIAFGPAPRFHVPERGRSGKDQDVIHAGCAWVGLDYRRIEGGAVEAVRRVLDFPMRPSVAVSSGYGLHLYFVFNAALRPERLVEWSDLMRALRSALRVDDDFSLAQVVRLPGTLNFEQERPVRCAIWEEHSCWTRYGFEEVREAAEKGWASARGASPASGAGFNDDPHARRSVSVDALRERGADADLLEAVITGRVRARPGGGANALEAASGRDFWVASRLYGLGFDREEVKTVFRSHPGGCGRTWARKRDGEGYLELTLSKVEQRAGTSRGGRALTGNFPGDIDGGESWLPPGYEQEEDGSVWYRPPVADGDRKAPKPVKVSNSLIRITEIRENIDTGQITLSVSFEYLGRGRTTRILRSHVSNGRQLVSALAGEGAPVTSNNARHVLAYLEAYEHAFAASIPHKKMTSRLGRGRSDGPFLLPGLTQSVEFAPQGAGDASLIRAYSSRRGSLRGWAEAMRVLETEGLIIPQVAILAALVPPIQRPLQIPNFILDVYGNTSTGKSTSLKLAASVYGRPHDPDSLIMQWMGTQSAVEQVAGVCGELPVFLDDAQHCPGELKRSVIYMIANGRGKLRSGGRAGMLEVPTWHTVALSTSEEPLHEASPHEGARGRILSVGGSVAPFPPSSASVVQSLERAVAENHGHAGEAYVRHLNGWTESDWLRWQRRYSAVRNELLKGASSNVLGRVSGYIASIQVAAEVACPLLGLPFKPDVVAAWLMFHLNEQECDRNMVLVALRALADHYVSNLSRFGGNVQLGGQRRKPLHGVARRYQFIGFLKSTMEEVFKLRRWNTTAMLSKLAAANVLLTTENDRYTKKISSEGVTHRMVCIKWSAILPDDLPLPEQDGSSSEI